MTTKCNSRQEGVRLLTIFHPVFHELALHRQTRQIILGIAEPCSAAQSSSSEADEAPSSQMARATILMHQTLHLRTVARAWLKLSDQRSYKSFTSDVP